MTASETKRAVTEDAIQQIIQSVCDEKLICQLGETRLPDRAKIADLKSKLRRLLFPGFFGERELTQEEIPTRVRALIEESAEALHTQILAVLRYAHELGLDVVAGENPDDDDTLAARLTQRFFDELAELRRMIALDVQAAYDGDPAAEHTDEIVLCYPGISAICSHRIAHALYRMGVPLLPRIVQELAHSETGIDIHPGCTIGESFFIDHGGAVVIGETAIIGNEVRMYQGVTLGAKSFEADERGRLVRSKKKRHPTIGDRVTIYAGAIILGGDTVIGDDCVVSGSVFITESVPAGHIVRHPKPELVLRQSDGDRGQGRVETEAGG
ncbi:MAG: serine O-acetyltransferase [Planctomycetota bacterium]